MASSFLRQKAEESRKRIDSEYGSNAYGGSSSKPYSGNLTYKSLLSEGARGTSKHVVEAQPARSRNNKDTGAGVKPSRSSAEIKAEIDSLYGTGVGFYTYDGIPTKEAAEQQIKKNKLYEEYKKAVDWEREYLSLRDITGESIKTPNAGGKYSRYDAQISAAENKRGVLTKEESKKITGAQNELTKDLYGFVFGQETALPGTDISDYETKMGYLRALDKIPKSGAVQRLGAAAQGVVANAIGSAMYIGDAAVQGFKNSGEAYAMRAELEDAIRRGDAAAISAIKEKYKDKLDTPVSLDTDGGKLITLSRDMQNKATYGLKSGQKFLMEAGISTANFLGATAMAGGNAAFALGLMGAQAAANQMYDAGEAGVKSYTRQVLSGIAAGAIEALTEKIPLENVLKFAGKGTRGLSSYLIEVFKNAGLEATEEGVNYAAGILAQKLILGGYAEDFSVEEMLYAIAQGGVSGGAVASVAGAPASAYNARVDREYTDVAKDYIRKGEKEEKRYSIDALISKGLKEEQGSEANNLARSLLNEKSRGEEMTLADLGRLVFLLDKPFMENYKKSKDGVQNDVKAVQEVSEGGTKWNENEAEATQEEEIDKSAVSTPLDDFPPILSPQLWNKDYKNDPDRIAAKQGDKDAAKRLAGRIINQDYANAIKEAYPDAVLVPVKDVESQGTNVLPEAFAERLAELTGLTIYNGIGKINKTGHAKAKNKIQRLLQRARFKGNIMPGQSYYLIVDDFVSLGGTIADLRNYIIQKGGKVVGAVTLSASNEDSLTLQMKEDTKNRLEVLGRDKIEKILREEKIANKLEDLTDAEGRAVAEIGEHAIRQNKDPAAAIKARFDRDRPPENESDILHSGGVETDRRGLRGDVETVGGVLENRQDTVVGRVREDEGGGVREVSDRGGHSSTASMDDISGEVQTENEVAEGTRRVVGRVVRPDDSSVNNENKSNKEKETDDEKIGSSFSFLDKDGSEAKVEGRESEEDIRVRGEILDYAKKPARVGLTRNEASEALSKKERRLLARVANIFGVEITLVDSLPFKKEVTNGFYENRHIFIAKDREDALFTVLAHEITHHLERTAKEAYAKYQKIAIEALGYNEETIEKEAKEEGLTSEGYKKEIAAYFTERFIGDPKDEAESRRRIMSIINADRNLALKVYNAVRDVINKLRGKLEPEYMNSIQGTLDYTEKLWRECLKESAKNRGKPFKEDGGQFSISGNLQKELNAVLKNTFNSRDNEVYIGETSNFLTKVIGAEPFSVLMPARKAYAAMVSEEYAKNDIRPNGKSRYDDRLNYHNLGAEGLIQVLIAAEDPVAAYVSKIDPDTGEKRDDRIVLVTGKIPNIGRAVVVYEVDTEGLKNRKRFKVNKVITSFNSDNILSGIKDAIIENTILFLDKKRSQNIESNVSRDKLETGNLNIDFKKNIEQFWANVKWKKSGKSEYSFGETDGKTALAAAFEKAQRRKDTEGQYSNSATANRVRDRMALVQQNAELKEEARSLAKEVSSQKRKIERLTSRVEKERAERRLTDGIRLKQSDIKAIAKSLVYEFSSEQDAREVEGWLTTLYNAMSNAVLRGKDPTERALASAKYISKKIVDKALTDVFDADDQKGMREDISAQKLLIPAEVRADARYKEEIREKMKGKIKSGTDGTEIDAAYSVLCEKYPAFFPDDILTPIDQITRMLDVYEALTPKRENPYAEDLEYAYESLAIRIAGMYYGVSQDPTFADKQAAKLRREKEKRRAESAALKEKFKAKDKKSRERQKAAEVRNKITRHVKALSGKLLTPTNEKHIPEEFRGAVASLLEYINLESEYSYNIATGKRQKGGAPDNSYPAKKTNAFRELKMAYREISEDAYSSIILDEELLFVIEELSELENVRLSEMTVEQLNNVWDVVKAVEHAVKTADKNLSEMKEQSARGTAKALIAGLRSMPRYVEKNEESTLGMAKKNFSDLLLMDMITPNEFFHMFGTAGDRVFNALRRAQDKYTVIVAETKKEASKWFSPEKIRQYEEKTYTFELESGKRAVLCVNQIMSLYCLSKREKAKSHIFGGGILISPIRQKGRTALLTQKEPLVLSENDLKEILSVLDREEYKSARETADKIQRYMSSTLSKYGNEASMAVYGYEKFKEKFYFPIKTPRSALRPKENDLLRDIGRKSTIAGKGFARQTKAGASSPVILDDIFTMFSDHVNEMATYSAYLATIEDIKRLTRVNVFDDAGEKKRLASVIDDKIGDRGVKYLDKLIDDINTGNVVRGDRAPTEVLLSKYKGAVIAANLRVIIQQPTSLLRALSEISPKYILRGIASLRRGDWRKLQKIAPIAQWKAWGYYDVYAGRQIKDLIFDTQKKLDRTLEWGAVPMQLMDAFTWNVLYHAAKAEAKAKGLKEGSAEHEAAVNDRFNYLIDKTQVVDGVLQRSQIARSDSAINRMSVSFMSEPLKMYNMVVGAARDIRTAEGDMKAAARKKLARTLVCVIIANIVNAAMQSLGDAIRDDDRDKKFWERWLKAFTGIKGDEENIGDMIAAIWQGNLARAVDPFGVIPYVRDVESLILGYSIDRMDMESVSLIVTSAKKLVKAFDEDSKVTVGAALSDVILNSGALLGIPAANLKRDILGIIKTYAIEADSHLFLYHLDKLFNSVDNDKNLGIFVDTYIRAAKTDPEAAQMIIYDLIESVPKERREERREKIRKKLDDSLKKEQGVESVKDLNERAILPDEKKRYDGIISSVQKTEAWKAATGEEKQKYKEKVYSYVIQNKSGKELAENVKNAKKEGISENKYFEYLLACESYNEYTKEQKEKLKNGEEVEKGLTQKEAEAAIVSINGLEDEQRAWLWQHTDKRWKESNNPFK